MLAEVHLSECVQRIYYAVFCVELLFEVFLLLLSLFVLKVVRKCGALHANLRVFLALKCLASAAYSVIRVYSLVDFLIYRRFLLFAPKWVSFIMGMGVLVNCHLCWAYTAERLLATVCMKSYEKQRPWFGTLTTLLIVVLTAVVVGHDTIASKEITVSRNTILAGFSFPAVGLVCLVTMAFLNRHNARRYRVGAKYTAFIHLSERYQNSENVRTTSQLAPLIFFHFLAGLLLAAFYASALFTLSTEVRFFILTSLSVTSCFAYIGCQVAVLYFHQGVRKRAQSKLTKLTKTFASAVWTTETRQGPNAYASKNSSVVFFKTIKADWDHEYEKRLGRFK